MGALLWSCGSQHTVPGLRRTQSDQRKPTGNPTVTDRPIKARPSHPIPDGLLQVRLCVRREGRHVTEEGTGPCCAELCRISMGGCVLSLCNDTFYFRTLNGSYLALSSSVSSRFQYHPLSVRGRTEVSSSSNSARETLGKESDQYLRLSWLT